MKNALKVRRIEARHATPTNPLRATRSRYEETT
jgi:hypothetical protein